MKKQSTCAAAWAALAASLMLAPAASFAQATGGFTPGNVIVMAVDGQGGTLTNKAAQVRLLEFDPTKGPADSATGKYLNLPTTVNGAQKRLTISGTAGTIGGLNLTLDGRYLMLCGFDAAPGQGSSASSGAIGRTPAATTNRVLARVDWTLADPAAAIDTSTALNNAFDQENPRNAASIDGSFFYIAGDGTPPTTPAAASFVTTGGVVSAAFGATSATLNVGGDATGVESIRRIKYYAGQLYGTSSNGGSKDKNGVQQGTSLYGLALIVPGSPGTTTTLNGFPVLTGTPTNPPGPFDFFFSNPTTVYIADAGVVTGGLQKWTFDGTKWNMVNNFTSAGVLSGLAGTYDASGHPVLYAITGGNNVVSIVDDGTITNSSSFTTIITGQAITSQVFRGIEVLPPTMTGRVVLGGVDFSKIPTGFAVDPVTVEYRLTGATTPYFKQTAVLAADTTDTTHTHAIYKLRGVSPGIYDLRIKTPKNLAVVLHNVTVGGVANLPDVTLPGGDADNNNTVDIGDFGILVNAYGSDASVSGSGYNAAADFNDDGVVDIGDFGILVNNYGTSGDM